MYRPAANAAPLIKKLNFDHLPLREGGHYFSISLKLVLYCAAAPCRRFGGPFTKKLNFKVYKPNQKNIFLP